MGGWSATIYESLASAESHWPEPIGADLEAAAELQWRSAIAAIRQLLQPTTAPLTHPESLQGLILSGPVPILTDPAIAKVYGSWIFAVDPLHHSTCQLPPAQASSDSRSFGAFVPLLPGDPLKHESFCLVLTQQFSFVATLGRTVSGRSSFQFSFAPEAVERAWHLLRFRVILSRSEAELQELEAQFQLFTLVEPPYQIVMEFSQRLLKTLANSAASPPPPASSGLKWSPTAVTWTAPSTPPAATAAGQGSQAALGTAPDFDVQLLQAIAHEVRTPLTTISTLTRLLLKRSDLPKEVIKRLEAIHRECSDQIDRFGLIFRAMELETNQAQAVSMQLTPVSLAQIFRDNLPRWQKLAARRNLTLEVSLPQPLPTVVSDPTMLDQVLTGLIDRFAHSLPMGSQIQVDVSLAGEQLKLQVRSSSALSQSASSPESQNCASPWQQVAPVLKSVGQLLMLQPETGNLSLSLPVTKNLFQALGGKLTVRHLPRQGEILTIFLPLGCD